MRYRVDPVRRSRAGGNPSFVVPAQAGIQSVSSSFEKNMAEKTSAEIESEVDAKGPTADHQAAGETERGKEREAEDRQFVPVVVKRSEESRRHPDDMLEKAVEEGNEQLSRRTFSLLLSSVAAGLILGFSAMAVAVASVAIELPDQPILERVIVALFYPFGFVMCIMSGAQLFTEHTATAVYPVLERKASSRQLWRLWLIVIVGNLLGTLASACLQALAEPVVGAADGYIHVGEHLVGFATLPMLISALLAGWLMAQGGWLLHSGGQMSGQIMSIYLVTFLIGVGGLHHSIAGSAEVFAAMLLGADISFSEMVRFIGVALLGNLIGGSLFVAVLNYTHIRSTQATNLEK